MSREPQDRGVARAQGVADNSFPAAQRFLRNIVRSRLLDAESLNRALRDVPDAIRNDAPALADFLVRTGKLTRYQARKLLKNFVLGLVLGKYQVLAPIAQGGMGRVFLARDGANGPLVALKILPPGKARRKQRSLVRFLREMAMAKHLRHPHLAWTLEAGKIEHIYFIAMEFIPGRSLLQLVNSEGPLSVSRAARLIAEAAEGLHHAHGQGVIHRDMKPSNIMVMPHDHVKILDLGLAMVEGETITDHRVVGGGGVIVGTMDFIAPEQTRNAAAVDRRADVYALGCTLYAALTGQVPFPGGDARDKIRRHRTEEPTPLRKLRPQVPAEFAALVHRMMAKDPNQRPNTCREVAETLRAWIGGETVLPLDQPGDADYQAAITEAAVSAAQQSSDATEELPIVERRQDWSGEPWPGGFRNLWLAIGLTAGLVAVVAGTLLLGYQAGWWQ